MGRWKKGGGRATQPAYVAAEIVVQAILDGEPPRSGYFFGVTKFNIYLEGMPPRHFCLNCCTTGPDFILPGDTALLRIRLIASYAWRHLIKPGAALTLNSASTVHFHGEIIEVVLLEPTG
jgi:hypothetical protein